MSRTLMQPKQQSVIKQQLQIANLFTFENTASGTFGEKLVLSSCCARAQAHVAHNEIALEFVRFIIYLFYILFIYLFVLVVA
jgi:hypothetical protein